MRCSWGLLVVMLTGCVQLFSLDEGLNVDNDNDNVVDHAAGGPDNCDGIFNPDQSDFDNDLSGDLCDTCDSGGAIDADADGILDGCDGCVSNGQDADADGIPDNCDSCVLVGADDADDTDDDGVPDLCDGCIGNGTDRDSDGIPDNCDSCVSSSTADSDVDGLPDACDPCPNGAGVDGDLDGIEDACDVCPTGGGVDLDQDGLEDAGKTGSDATGCDLCYGPNLDEDKDGLHDACDNCPGDHNPEQYDGDGFAGQPDGVGTACEVDDQPGTRLFFDPFTSFVPDWQVAGGTWMTGPSELLMITDAASSRQRYTVNGSFRIATLVTAFDTSMLKSSLRLYASSTSTGAALECVVHDGAVTLLAGGGVVASSPAAPMQLPFRFILSFDANLGVAACEASPIAISAQVNATVSFWSTGLGGESTTARFAFFSVTSSY